MSLIVPNLLGPVRSSSESSYWLMFGILCFCLPSPSTSQSMIGNHVDDKSKEEQYVFRYYAPLNWSQLFPRSTYYIRSSDRTRLTSCLLCCSPCYRYITAFPGCRRCTARRRDVAAAQKKNREQRSRSYYLWNSWAQARGVDLGALSIHSFSLLRSTRLGSTNLKTNMTSRVTHADPCLTRFQHKSRVA